MKILLDNYKNSLSHLNGSNILHFNKWDFIRASITVGYQTDKQIIKRGFWPVIERISQALAYIAWDSDAIKFNDSYNNLEKSDKDSISYKTAEILAKLFAEEYLDVPRVIKPKFLDDQYKILNKTNPKIKYHLKNTKKKAGEPDFVGPDTKGNWHVIESKGRAAYLRAEHQHAINQANIIGTIAQKKPLSYSAAYFILRKNGFEGKIIDPPSKGAIDLKIDEFSVIKEYYSVFLNPAFSFSFNGTISNRTFSFFPYVIPGFLIGLDLNIMNNIKQDIFDNDFNLWYKKNFFENKTNSPFSIGPDGVVVIENDHMNRWRPCKNSTQKPVDI